MKVLEKIEIIRQLTKYVKESEVDINLPQLGRAIKLPTLNGYLSGDSLPTTANCELIKTFLLHDAAGRAAIYDVAFAKRKPARINERIAAMELALATLKEARAVLNG